VRRCFTLLAIRLTGGGNRFDSKIMMRRHRTTIRGLCLAAALAAGATVAGCQKPLFPGDLPRTQYERYDRLRGRSVPAERQTARGQSEPALRERLQRSSR